MCVYFYVFFFTSTILSPPLKGKSIHIPTGLGGGKNPLVEVHSPHSLTGFTSCSFGIGGDPKLNIYFVFLLARLKTSPRHICRLASQESAVSRQSPLTPPKNKQGWSHTLGLWPPCCCLSIFERRWNICVVALVCQSSPLVCVFITHSGGDAGPEFLMPFLFPRWHMKIRYHARRL